MSYPPPSISSIIIRDIGNIRSLDQTRTKTEKIKIMLHPEKRLHVCMLDDIPLLYIIIVEE